MSVLTVERFQEASRHYHETHTVCRAPGCQTGWVDTGLVDPDQVPIRKACRACKGNAFVKLQLDLFPETLT